MSRTNRGVWLVVMLVMATAWPALAADEKKPPAAKPPMQKLKLAGGDSVQDKAAGEQPAAESDDRFVVPKGTPKELVAFITKLISGQPPRDGATLKKLRKAILQAAEKILAAKPSDEEMEFAVQAKMNMLDKPEQLNDFIAELKKGKHEKLARMVRGFMLQIELRKLMMTGNKDTKKTIEEAVKFFEEAPPLIADITLAYTTGMMSEMNGDAELATKTYGRLAKVFAASDNPKLAEFAKVLEGVVRRLSLVGQELKIEGKTLEGQTFDWSKYSGKVVLVAFWASEYPSCVREIPNLKGFYELYHDKGFEIVGVSLDRKLNELEDFIKTKSIPWPNVIGEGGKPNPSVVYYGIMNLPTLILVGKDGKVLSLNPYGEGLRKELDKLLGPVEPKKEKEKSKE